MDVVGIGVVVLPVIGFAVGVVVVLIVVADDESLPDVVVVTALVEGALVVELSPYTFW